MAPALSSSSSGPTPARDRSAAVSSGEERYRQERARIEQGHAKYRDKLRAEGKLFVRDRLKLLLDPGSDFQEDWLFAPSPEPRDHAVGGGVGLGGAGGQPPPPGGARGGAGGPPPGTDGRPALRAKLVAVLRVALLDPGALLAVALLARAHGRAPITGWGWSRG